MSNASNSSRIRLNRPITEQEIADMYAQIQADFNDDLTLSQEELRDTITRLNIDFMKEFGNDG